MKKKIIKNGVVGEFKGFVIFCNEKDEKRGKFLFKCCKGCRHNPFEPALINILKSS